MAPDLRFVRRDGRWDHSDEVVDAQYQDQGNQDDDRGREGSYLQHVETQSEGGDDQGRRLERESRDRSQEGRYDGDRRSRTISSGRSRERLRQRSPSGERYGGENRRHWLNGRQAPRRGRRERSGSRRSREDFRRGFRRSWSREEFRRRGRRRSRSGRYRREQRRGRARGMGRRVQPEVVQLKKDMASLSHNLNIIKASSETITLPPMGHKGHQTQVEINVGLRHILVNQMRTELARMYPEGVSPTLMEIIKRGEDKINKRNTLIHIADVYGWEVANEYEGNVIGLNDLDNKKLEEAEKRVQKKREKKAKEAQIGSGKKESGCGRLTNRRRSEERKGGRSKSRENRYLIGV